LGRGRIKVGDRNFLPQCNPLLVFLPLKTLLSLGFRILDIFADSKALLSDVELFLRTEDKYNTLQVLNQNRLADDLFPILYLYLFLCLCRDQMDQKAY